MRANLWLHVLLLTALVSARRHIWGDNPLSMFGDLRCDDEPLVNVTVEVLEEDDPSRDYHQYGYIGSGATGKDGLFTATGTHDNTMSFYPLLRIVGPKCGRLCTGTRDILLAYGDQTFPLKKDWLEPFDLKAPCDTTILYWDAYARPPMPAKNYSSSA